MSVVRIMSVCGSGVVTSSMVANKLQEMLAEEGYEAKITETMPSSMATLVQSDHFDLIAYSSPITETFGIPALSAIGLITGLGVEQFKNDALKIFRDAGKLPG